VQFLGGHFSQQQLLLFSELQFCFVPHGRVLFGKGCLIMYDVSSTNITYSVVDTFVVLLLGAIAGILGSLYNSLEDTIVQTYRIMNDKGVITKNEAFMTEVVFHNHILIVTNIVVAIKKSSLTQSNTSV